MLVPDLDSALASAESGYYRLVLLVGPAASGKTRRLRELAEAAGHPLVAYADGAHPEHRVYRAPEATIVVHSAAHSHQA